MGSKHEFAHVNLGFKEAIYMTDVGLVLVGYFDMGGGMFSEVVVVD